ncbi:MAG: hypothetical protein RML40_01215 [Bacteroidota bacterium]|nr:hypothetical protein [Candidatus Kapabacteria bacterium]MDW8219128.1 hypothetical protein [Bacteroidota bacterium]
MVWGIEDSVGYVPTEEQARSVSAIGTKGISSMMSQEEREFFARVAAQTNITAFDSGGNSYIVDEYATIAQKRPVIVITFNERANIDDSLRVGLITSAQLVQEHSSSVLLKNNSLLSLTLPYMRV